MVDLIMGMVEFLFDAIAGFGSNSVVSPEAFNAELYEEALSISTNVIKPIGYALLSLFGLLELISITTRYEGTTGTLGLEIPIRFMLKFAICKFMLDNVDTVLTGLSDMSMEIIDDISYSGDTLADISSGQDQIRSVIESQNIIVQVGTLGQVLVMWFLMIVISVVIMAILYARMIQMYLYISIAPIPFSTFTCRELSSIGKNFTKSFAALCLQGVFIFLILRFYGSLVNNVLSSTNFSDWSDAFSNMLMSSVVLLICIIMSGSLAKSILNAA